MVGVKNPQNPVNVIYEWPKRKSVPHTPMHILLLYIFEQLASFWRHMQMKAIVLRKESGAREMRITKMAHYLLVKEA